MRVLITGATGFLGRYVVEELLARGRSVRLAGRTPPEHASEQVEVARVDARDDNIDFSALLTGVSDIVHLAGMAHRPVAYQTANRELYAAVNTRFTSQLAEAAANAGIRSFVFMSSIAVNGPSTDGRAPFSSTDEARPVTPYGETKAAAEDALRLVQARSEMPIAMLRPPMIYGRNAKGSFDLLTKALRAHVPLPLGSIRNRRAFVGGGNVASAVAFCTETRASGVYLVADNEQISTHEFVRRLATALRKSPVLIPVPQALLKVALRSLGKGDMVESLMASLELDASPLAKAGWQPPVSLDAGLIEAVNR